MGWTHLQIDQFEIVIRRSKIEINKEDVTHTEVYVTPHSETNKGISRDQDFKLYYHHLRGGTPWRCN